MSEERLAPGIEVSALLRRADAEGGVGTLLYRGDESRGAILIEISERGQHRAFLERTLQQNGLYHWSSVGPGQSDSNGAAQYVERRRRSDPDCWILELDIPSAERFIAETTSTA